MDNVNCILCQLFIWSELRVYFMGHHKTSLSVTTSEFLKCNGANATGLPTGHVGRIPVRASHSNGQALLNNVRVLIVLLQARQVELAKQLWKCTRI